MCSGVLPAVTGLRGSRTGIVTARATVITEPLGPCGTEPGGSPEPEHALRPQVAVVPARTPAAWTIADPRAATELVDCPVSHA